MSDFYDKVRKNEKKKKPRKDFIRGFGIVLVIILLILLVIFLLFILPLIMMNRFNYYN